MTSTIVKYDNWTSAAWADFYDILNTRSIVLDPVGTTSVVRKWIYSRMPDVKSDDFKDFPFIILNPFSVDFSVMQSLSGSKSFVMHTVDIEVITTDRARNGKDLKGAAMMDTVSDAIIAAFNSDGSTAPRQLLRANSLANVKVSSVSPARNVVLFDQMCYRRVITVSCKTRKGLYLNG